MLLANYWTIASAFMPLWIFYTIIEAIYRLFFSPVAKFPGPKLAALTFWYEFYYDVVKGGKYTWEIGKMHQRYGPIVRINPYELHIDDPNYYDVLYAGGSTRRDKWEWSAKMFGNSKSMLGTVPHDHHRIRRAALSPYFSKQSVTRLEPLIQSVVDKLCTRFEELRASGEPVDLGHAYAALTMDIITTYCFAKSYDCVEKHDFAPEFLRLVEDISIASHINKQFGWLMPSMRAMPVSLVARIFPNMMPTINIQKDMETQIKAIMDGRNDYHESTDHPTLFHELLRSDLSPDEKSLPRLVEEGQTLVAAGQITTAHFLKVTSFHVLANPEILQRLKSELAWSMPDPKSSASRVELEKLPYLSAVVKEGFRLSYGVTHRLQRVSPDAPLVFQGWIIPPGTPVGMTSVFMHENPEIFPEPYKFRPDRWLEGDQDSGRLDKYLVNFSKGTRACLGINLAVAEIYLTLANVFRRLDMKLYRTTREDVDLAHDFFNPRARLDSKGVRVVFE